MTPAFSSSSLPSLACNQGQLPVSTLRRSQSLPVNIRCTDSQPCSPVAADQPSGDEGSIVKSKPLPERSVTSSPPASCPPGSAASSLFPEGSGERQLDEAIACALHPGCESTANKSFLSKSIKEVYGLYLVNRVEDKPEDLQEDFQHTLYITLLALLRADDPEGEDYQSVLKSVAQQIPVVAQKYTDIITFCTRFDTTSVSEEILDEALTLANETYYPPLIWKLFKLAMQPGGKWLSPATVMQLFLSTERTLELNALILNIMRHSQSDQLIFKYIGEQTVPESEVEKVLAAMLGPFLDEYWTIREFVPIPGIDSHCQKELQNALTPLCIQIFRKSTMKKAIYEHAATQHREILNTVEGKLLVKKSKIATPQDRQRVQSLNLVPRIAWKSLKEKCEFQVRALGALISNCKSKFPYLADAMRLVQACYFDNWPEDDSSKKMLAALTLRQCAQGSFPLIDLDAARLFAKSGNFERAISSLNDLLRKEDFPITITIQAQTLKEIFQKRWDEIEFFKKYRDSQPKKDAGEKDKASKKKEKKRKNIPSAAAASPVPEPSEPVAVTPATETLSPGWSQMKWLPDDHPVIRHFLAGLRKARSSLSPVTESAFLNKKLEKASHINPAVYTRICEEACWFYLTQVLFAWDDQACYLRADKKRSDGSMVGLIQLASLWLAKAEARCTNCPPVPEIKLDQFREQAEQALQQMPETIDQQEYKKRLGALSSSRGHIHSALSSLPEIAAKRKHSHIARDFYNYRDEIVGPGQAPD